MPGSSGVPFGMLLISAGTVAVVRISVGGQRPGITRPPLGAAMLAPLVVALAPSRDLRHSPSMAAKAKSGAQLGKGVAKAAPVKRNASFGTFLEKDNNISKCPPLGGRQGAVGQEGPPEDHREYHL